MNKKNRVRFWLLTGFLILFGGMTTYAMEIGGFDVEIGAGESAAYPDGWWDTPSCGDTEENAPDSLISGEAFAEASFDALEELESGSEADFTAEQGVKQEILKQQETLEQQAGPDSAVQEPAIQNREADEAMAVTESENTPAPSLMPSSTENLFPGPAIAAHPANTITPVPEAEKGVPLSEAGLSEGVFPVSALQRILAGSTKIKLETMYWKDTINAMACPQLLVQTEGGFHILSFRVNGLECLYHWEKDRIILEQEPGNTGNVIELIALCEKDTKIRVWTE